ncbi:MAG: hypothetical protein AB7V39_16240 [Nitrospiraceae bacterium]
MSDITARFHIPTQTYGFLELEGKVTDLPELERLYNRYAEKPLEFREPVAPTTQGEKVVTTFTGEQLKYNAVTHRYVSMDGKPLLSGSHYAERFGEPFDKERLLNLTAKKLGQTAAFVDEAWQARGEMSRTFGTALHKAMEVYFKYNGIGYGIPKHPFLKQAVESFPYLKRNVLSELMVSDVKNGLVGQLDALEIVEPKVGVIWDFKSDADVKKNLTKHFNQLSFYAHILMAHGWQILGVTVWNYTDAWQDYRSEVLPLQTVAA